MAVGASTIAAAFAIISCNSSGTETAESAAPAGAFENSVYADIAGDDRHVWVLVAGRDTDGAPLGIRVFQRTRGHSWRALPRIPWTTNGRGSFAIAAWRRRPCAVLPRHNPRFGDVVACLYENRWRVISDRSAIDRQTIGQITAYRDGLLAMTTTPERRTRRTTHEIFRWRGREWRRLGAPIRARSGIVALGRTGQGGRAPDVLVESTGATPPTRTIYRLVDGRWRRVGEPIVGATIGPNVSGPVHRHGTTWVAVTEAGRTPWTFSVVHRTGEDGAWRQRELNVGRGNAQGAVYPTRTGIWAIWVESIPHGRGQIPFTEQIWAARLDRSSIRPMRLHAGPSVGPGDIAVTEGAGRTWALYMRTTQRRGMRAAVRALPEVVR